MPEDQAQAWLVAQGAAAQTWAKAQGWTGQLGKALVVTDTGEPIFAAIGMGVEQERHKMRFGAVSAIASLPSAVFNLLEDNIQTANEFALGFALSKYRYTRYASQAAHAAELICPVGVDKANINAIISGEFLTRDLINTPANDMGPSELEEEVRKLAKKHKATISVITGDALLKQNLPMIHAVGRASARAPRLIDMKWGDSGPSLTLVGKGVCFDTGGLNIKAGSSMGLMKKDMGGAAHVLGLAQMIMATNLKLRLRVLIPAVENAIGNSAFRPQDILTSRKGLRHRYYLSQQ